MTKLSQFFRNVGGTVARNPEVRTAVRELEKQVAQEVARGFQRFADGFEAPKVKPVAANQASANADYVTGLYRDLLGREPDAEGLRSHLAGMARGATREDIRQVFLTSPEYRAKQAVAPTEAPAAPSAGDARHLGPVPLEGFDSGKLADPNHTSVKYLFGRVATHYGLDSVKDKAGAEALLNRMVPDLQAAGLDIVGVKGDRLLMKTPLGLESIDVVRGAGSGQPGWWWGADGTVASPQEIARFSPLAAPTSVPVTPSPPAGTVAEPGVPLTAEYSAARIDTSSPSAAAFSAAQWAKDTYPELFAHSDDRQVCFQIMTKVVGALRSAGYDATRVVNHPDRAVGDGWRYGSDAIVLNGEVFDVYRGMGESNTPQALDAGPYEAGRLRE